MALSGWTDNDLRVLRHAGLTVDIATRHAIFWKRIHSVAHAVTALLTFLTVIAAIAKEELTTIIAASNSSSVASAVLGPLNISCTVLPLCASVLLILQRVLSPRRKWAALRLAAASAESELMRYRGAVGRYTEASSRQSALVEALQSIWEELRPPRALRSALFSFERAAGRPLPALAAFRRADASKCPRDSNPRPVAEPQPANHEGLQKSRTFESHPDRRAARRQPLAANAHRLLIMGRRRVPAAKGQAAEPLRSCGSC